MKTDVLKKHLKQVILKMDFVTPMNELNDNVPPKLNEIIMQSFMIAEPKELLERNLQMSANTFSQSDSKIKEWNYYSREREKQFTITKYYFCIIHTQYSSFKQLRADFIQIMNKLFELKPKPQFGRIGLRYVNTIKGEQNSSVFDWKDTLNEKLLSIFDVPNVSEKKKISRAFQVLELNLGKFNLRFQYGMHNPDFPAIIKQKLFTLDFDAYYQGLLSEDSKIDAKIDMLHNAIKKMIKNC